MKLFKKTITVAILSLLLASCNVNPSSSSPSTSAPVISSSSVSSVSSVQDLTTIDLTTTSQTLQTLGLTSNIEVRASFNNGNLTLDKAEWYLNGVRSLSQNGTIFEFLPTEARVYNIQARIGSIASNTIQIRVERPNLNVSNVSVLNSTQIRVSGEAGLQFTLPGVTILNNSNYVFQTNTYTLNLNTPLIQGNQYSLNITKTGFKDFVYSFRYDTRTLEVGDFIYRGNKIALNSSGVYQIARPVSESFEYTISLKHKDLQGSNVPLSIVSTVPTGADPISSVQTTRNIERDININQRYPVTSTTSIGLYRHNISIGGVTIEVSVQVIDPTPSVELDTKIVFDDFSKGTMSTPFAIDASGDYVNEFVELNSLGEYVVFRPFKGEKKTFTFRVKADNFRLPVGLSGNQFFLRFALVGPVGPIMYYERTISTATANTLPQEVPFSTNAVSELVHYIDNSTDLGVYQFTVTAHGAISPVSRSFKVVVREKLPTIVPYIEYNGTKVVANSDGSFTLNKPIGSNVVNTFIGVKIENFESPLFPVPQTTTTTGIDTRYVSTGSQERWLLNYLATYSGPLSRPSTTTKIAVELGQSVAANTTVVDTIPSLVVVKDYQRFKSDKDDIIIRLSDIPDLTNYTVSTSMFSPFETLSAATFPGTHSFNIQIGRISTPIVLRVVEATPNVILKEDSVRYGFETISEENVEFKITDNKYYVNGVNGMLHLDVYPFGMPTGTYIYTYSVTKPNGLVNSTTNAVTLTLRTDDPGVETYDGTLKFPPVNDPGSSVINPGHEMVVRDSLDQEGEYVYSFTINGRSLVVRIVVLAAPQLRVNSIKYNGVSLPNSGDTYYLPRADSARFLEIELEPINIKDNYEYAIIQDGLFPSGEDLILAKRELSISQVFVNTGVEIDLSSGAATATVTDSFFIVLYNENRIVGKVTKINIVSRPLEFSTFFFVTNGGTLANTSPITNPVGTSGIDISSRVPTRTGYDFSGWFTNPDFVGSAINISTTLTHASSDTIFYAKWTRFTITYNLNGGALASSAPATFTTAQTTGAGLTLPIPTKTGSSFVGWFTDQALTVSAGSAITTTGNKVLYAKWNP
jgi:uncharacterized repeat protein (TIGR02543 family)